MAHPQKLATLLGLRERVEKNFKNMFYSDLFDRLQYESWQNKGAKSIEERLREKTLKLISAPDPTPLAPQLVKELDARQKTWEKW